MLRSVNINVANNTPGGSAKKLQPLHHKLTNFPSSIKRINFEENEEDKSFVEETSLKKPTNQSNAKPTGNSNFMAQTLQQKNNKQEVVKKVEDKKNMKITGKLRVPDDPDMRFTYTGWNKGGK